MRFLYIFYDLMEKVEKPLDYISKVTFMAIVIVFWLSMIQELFGFAFW